MGFSAGSDALVVAVFEIVAPTVLPTFQRVVFFYTSANFGVFAVSCIGGEKSLVHQSVIGFEGGGRPIRTTDMHGLVYMPFFIDDLLRRELLPTPDTGDETIDVVEIRRHAF